MGLVDFILNLAGILLWLNWRGVRLAPAWKEVSILRTLTQAKPRPPRRWINLVALVALLIGRAFFYRQAGSTTGWTPRLDLGAIYVPFRTDLIGRMLLFSFLSFLIALAVFYSWLLLLSVVNRHVPDTEPLQALVRSHLGPVERWPAIAKLLLLPFAAALLWLVLHPILTRLEMVPGATPPLSVFQESLVLAISSLLAWKYLLIGLLVLHLINSYVYLGNVPFWNFIQVTGRNLLHPIRWLPLRIGRIDMAPVAVIVLILVLAHFGERGVTQLFQRIPMEAR